MQRKGIDISTWQGSGVNFNNLKKDGIEFVIIRAGFGRYTSQKDNQFENNYSKAKAAGMPVGAYWYSYATSVAGAKEEAKTCLAVIKGKQFEYPIYFDLEDPSQSGLSKAVKSDMVVAFCEELEAAGYFTGLYSNLNWLNNHLDYNKIKPYTLWLAQWASKPTYSNTFDMWQYTSDGTTSGTPGRTDMNYCYKDFPTIIKEAGLNGFSKGSSTPTPTPSKSVDELAKEVIAGKWGNGNDRKNKLTAAGYDYNAVQNKVNEMLGQSSAPAKKSNEEIAKEIIRGDWGNGNDRKKRLEAAGYNYSTIQSLVNSMLNGGGSSAPAKKSIDEIAREVIRGDWGNGNDRKKRLEAAGYNYSEVQKRVNQLL